MNERASPRSTRLVSVTFAFPSYLVDIQLIDVFERASMAYARLRLHVEDTRVDIGRVDLGDQIRSVVRSLRSRTLMIDGLHHAIITDRLHNAFIIDGSHHALEIHGLQQAFEIDGLHHASTIDEFYRKLMTDKSRHTTMLQDWIVD
eukprot:4988823-Pleurochrysis_carterae.AAC.1